MFVILWTNFIKSIWYWLVYITAIVYIKLDGLYTWLPHKFCLDSATYKPVWSHIKVLQQKFQFIFEQKRLQIKNPFECQKEVPQPRKLFLTRNCVFGVIYFHIFFTSSLFSLKPFWPGCKCTHWAILVKTDPPLVLEFSISDKIRCKGTEQQNWTAVTFSY